jgi:hypothetical protein
MFGLEGSKKKKTESFAFDLETKLTDKNYRQELMSHIYEQVKLLKEQLREGASQETYETFSKLLNGYQALLKVVTRFEKTK